eukprot:11158122-Lingulodinium_polyedra.AAC.1
MHGVRVSSRQKPTTNASETEQGGPCCGMRREHGPPSRTTEYRPPPITEPLGPSATHPGTNGTIRGSR